MTERVRLEQIVEKEASLGDVMQTAQAQDELDAFKAYMAQKAEAAKATNNHNPMGNLLYKNLTRVVCWGDDSQGRSAPPPAPPMPRRHSFGGAVAVSAVLLCIDTRTHVHT